MSRLRGQGGIGTCLVQTFHNWLFSGLARQLRRHRALKPLLTPAMPFLLLLAALDNLTALALDHLNKDDLRFTPNLWVVVQKATRVKGMTKVILYRREGCYGG